MKKFMVLALSLALVFGAAVARAADNAAAGAAKKSAMAAGKPAVVVTDLVTVTATVQAVDAKKRTVTLKGPEGNVRTFKVDKRVKNLAQVKAGDQLELDFYESLAMYVTAKGGKPEAGAATMAAVAAPGEKPGGVVVSTVEVKAKIEAVDAAKRTVTLKGPEGNVSTFKVGKDVKLENIKAGDDVVVRYTEAVAVSVRTPGKAKEAAPKK